MDRVAKEAERRRRWSAAEKVAMVAETHEPGMTVSLVARDHSMASGQLFRWRRLAGQCTLTAADRDDEAARAFVYRALQNWVCEQQRRLGKRALEGDILRPALGVTIGPIKHQLQSLACRSGRRADVANRG